MPTKEKINFKQPLDFSETFNLSVKFIRQNFFHLIKCLLLIAGPFILMTAIANGYYQKSVFSSEYLRSGDISTLFVQISILLITTVLASLTLIGVTYEYFMLYVEKGLDGFDVNDVGRALLRDMGNIAWTFFSLFFFMLVFFGIIVLLGVGLGKISPILLVIMIILMFFGFLIIMPPMMFVFTATYLVRLKEKNGFFDSVSRVFSVMKGNFWWTWLIMFCVYLAVALIQMVFLIPQTIMSMVVAFSAVQGERSDGVSIAFLIISAAGTFFSTLMYFIFLIFSSVHYYSLEEKKEGKGLMERIGEIGIKKEDSIEGTY